MKDFPSEFEIAEESPGYLLWITLNRWQRDQRRALAPLNLTHVQFVLLASLAYREKLKKTTTGIQLATQAQTDPMMTSQVLRALVKQGLIKRQDHPVDSRAYLLATTAKGQALLKKAMPEVENVDRIFFAPLGKRKKEFTKDLLRLTSDV